MNREAEFDPETRPDLPDTSAEILSSLQERINSFDMSDDVLDEINSKEEDDDTDEDETDGEQEDSEEDKAESDEGDEEQSESEPDAEPNAGSEPVLTNEDLDQIAAKFAEYEQYVEYYKDFAEKIENISLERIIDDLDTTHLPPETLEKIALLILHKTTPDIFSPEKQTEVERIRLERERDKMVRKAQEDERLRRQAEEQAELTREEQKYLGQIESFVDTISEDMFPALTATIPRENIQELIYQYAVQHAEDESKSLKPMDIAKQIEAQIQQKLDSYVQKRAKARPAKAVVAKRKVEDSDDVMTAFRKRFQE